jgi:hypothetical protein
LRRRGRGRRDLIVVVLGCEVPVVLRRVDGDGDGDGDGEVGQLGWCVFAWVYGWAEAVVGLERERYEVRVFEIC